MTWLTEIRVHNPSLDGADYTLTPDAPNTFQVYHSGAHAGRVACHGDYWSATAAPSFGAPVGYVGTPLGTADTMADAVALLHQHWNDQP